jgi:hypothetical protein
MLSALTPATWIFEAVAPVDLRRSFDGLSAHVQGCSNSPSWRAVCSCSPINVATACACSHGNAAAFGSQPDGWRA